MSAVSRNVMAGLGPAIHDFRARKVMDTRPKGGHDGSRTMRAMGLQTGRAPS